MLKKIAGIQIYHIFLVHFLGYDLWARNSQKGRKECRYMRSRWCTMFVLLNHTGLSLKENLWVSGYLSVLIS